MLVNVAFSQIYFSVSPLCVTVVLTVPAGKMRSTN